MIGKLLVLGVLSAGAYVGARRLIDQPALIEQVPEPLREPARKLRAQLIEVRTAMQQTMAEVDRERADAEAELRTDYMSRARRRADEAPAGTASDAPA